MRHFMGRLLRHAPCPVLLQTGGAIGLLLLIAHDDRGLIFAASLARLVDISRGGLIGGHRRGRNDDRRCRAWCVDHRRRRDVSGDIGLVDGKRIIARTVIMAAPPFMIASPSAIMPPATVASMMPPAMIAFHAQGEFTVGMGEPWSKSAQQRRQTQKRQHGLLHGIPLDRAKSGLIRTFHQLSGFFMSGGRTLKLLLKPAFNRLTDAVEGKHREHAVFVRGEKAIADYVPGQTDNFMPSRCHRRMNHHTWTAI